MKTEMDLMRMDERQRLHWLMANRATLLVVGCVWLLMIGWDLWQGRMPAFLIAMVPVFAAVRLGFYLFYARDRDARWIEQVLFFVLVAGGHFGATVAAMVGEFSTSGLFGLFPEPGYEAWSAALRILEFPLLTILRMSDPLMKSDASTLLMVVNSLLWGGVIYVLVRLARGRAGRAEPELGVSG